MKVVQQPRFFDSLHTLNVWTPYAKLMRNIHELFNGHVPYIPADIVLFPGGAIPYQKNQILESLAGNKEVLWIYLNDRRRNSLCFSGNVVGVHCATPTAFVLTVSGDVERNEMVAPVSMSCFYETGDYGCNHRGFCLLPELAWQQVGCCG